VQLRDARCEPKPVQRPHPPIAIGGNGPTRTLRTVARFAQHWNSTADLEHWPAIKSTLEKRCAEIGRDPSTIECSVNLRFDPSAGAAAIADTAAAFGQAGADIGIVYLPVPHTASVLEGIADALRPLAH
jgi:alkanesulfonate monooxygenase SsuD/methylene tetrahydromethanopterin reductase-like flavin-dependent oxidoreductase (luciferase family)